jgi:hypothetical protein
VPATARAGGAVSTESRVSLLFAVRSMERWRGGEMERWRDGEVEFDRTATRCYSTLR